MMETVLVQNLVNAKTVKHINEIADCSTTAFNVKKSTEYKRLTK